MRLRAEITAAILVKIVMLLAMKFYFFDDPIEVQTGAQVLNHWSQYSLAGDVHD